MCYQMLLCLWSWIVVLCNDWSNKHHVIFSHLACSFLVTYGLFVSLFSFCLVCLICYIINYNKMLSVHKSHFFPLKVVGDTTFSSSELNSFPRIIFFKGGKKLFILLYSVTGTSLCVILESHFYQVLRSGNLESRFLFRYFCLKIDV